MGVVPDDLVIHVPHPLPHDRHRRSLQQRVADEGVPEGVYFPGKPRLFKMRLSTARSRRSVNWRPGFGCCFDSGIVTTHCHRFGSSSKTLRDVGLSGTARWSPLLGFQPSFG